MRLMNRGLAATALAAAVLVGCKKKEAAPPPPVAQAPAPASLRSLTLGSAIGADKSVAAAKDTFRLRDTIYVSVATEGTGDNVKLKAVWTFGTETVRADSQILTLSGPAVSEFHISRPRAWPVGAYRVTVTLNDAGALTRDFTVR
jgi:hypothetical protein